MRISQIYNINRNQASLDFVDVDTATDISVFLDPHALRLQNNHWARECQALLTSFFSAVLDAIRKNKSGEVRSLLSRLGEPNETHFGFSRGRSRGRGLGGGKKSEEVADSLSNSKAAATGLLQDLEDAALLVPGIGSDIISDITTHVLRGALIGYTHQACNYHKIPMEEQHSGPVWNPDALEWQEGFVQLPRTKEGKLLLVPKSTVRHRLIYDKDQYYNGYLAPHLEEKEIQASSELVHVLKNQERKVYRDDLRVKYPADKLAIVDYTLEFPGALQHYRESVGTGISTLLDHDVLASKVGAPRVDYDEILEEIQSIAPGRAGAHMYHRSVEKLLTALFYPSLGNFTLEAEIHEGRKRVDIQYDNLATSGFFNWVNENYFCPIVPIECKNYSEDPNNPELDQLAWRLSHDRGWLGILVCRSIEDKELLTKRCRDTAKDKRGYILTLDDKDLIELTREAKDNINESLERRSRFTVLRKQFGRLL